MQKEKNSSNIDLGIKKIRLSMLIQPPKIFKVNYSAILEILIYLIKFEIKNNSFLKECGIRFFPEYQTLIIMFKPVSKLKINPFAVIKIVKHYLAQIINESFFLKTCNIEFLSEE